MTRVLAKAKALWMLVRGTDERARKLHGVAQLLKPYRWRSVVTLVAILAATAAGLAPPYLAGRAIDTGIRTGDLSALDWIVVAFIGAAVVYWAATYAQTYLSGWVGQRALTDLRTRIFSHLQTMSIGFYSRRKTGVLISRLTNDIQALDQLVTDGVVTLLASGLTLIGTVVILIVLDWQLALVTFGAFPILALGSIVFRIVAADAYRKTREKIANITSYLQETLSGVRIVRAFAQENRHIDDFAELNEQNRAANMKTVYLNAAYFPAVELLSAVGTAIILLYGGFQVINGNLAIGIVVAFVGYLQTFFDPIQQLSNLYTTYQQGMAALDKIFELLDEQPDLVEREDPIELPQLRGEVTFDGVAFSYVEQPTADDDWALRDVDLVIPPGQTVALVGHTGAGKSTFAKLVARFYDPQRGRVVVDGNDLRDVSFKSLRSQLGIVPQEGFLFSGTVRENIAFGKPNATDDEVAAAIEAVAGTDLLEQLPEGLDSEVGERGGSLSSGQRQLVAFARAMIADPRILILDEATSSIDVQTEAKLVKGLTRLLAGRTAIVIAHRLSTIRRAARIVVLEHGRIAESGTHDELVAASGAYAELYRDWRARSAA